MKKTYLILFALIFVIFLLIALYFVDIPSPSKLVTEDHTLNIK